MKTFASLVVDTKSFEFGDIAQATQQALKDMFAQVGIDVAIIENLKKVRLDHPIKLLAASRLFIVFLDQEDLSLARLLFDVENTVYKLYAKNGCNYYSWLNPVTQKDYHEQFTSASLA